MFADDLLLFGEASTKQAECMMDCLDRFCIASGEKVSADKSSLFFSPKVPISTKSAIQDITQMRITTDIGKYLGFPLSRKRKPQETFQYILDRVNSKLANWKANSLSMAGRITLANSVISAVPLYPMQVSQIPISICKEIERLQCNFIWGNSNPHGYHNLSWDALRQPKLCGGLGCKNLVSMNQAFGCKLAWQIVSGSNNLWSEVLCKKYLYREEDRLLHAKIGDSQLWRFICKQERFVESGTKWRIRDGRSVRFFIDIWILLGERIQDHCIRQLSVTEKGSFVSDWIINGAWDYAQLGSIVSCDIIRRLFAFPPPSVDAGNDLMIWGGSRTGIFSVKSAYHFIEKPNEMLAHPCFKLLWKWQGAERIRTFMWLAFQNKLPTNEWRSKWSSSSALCSYCNSQVESLIHILRDCSFARNMWVSLVNPCAYSSFFSAQLRDWFHLNLKNEIGQTDHFSWDLVFGVGIWMLWNWRNRSVFNSEFVRPLSPSAVLLRMIHQFVIVDRPGGNVASNSSDHSVWQPPMQDWIKVNVDGAVSLNRSSARCGGVLRDSTGSWVTGFSSYLGICEPQEAEEWALLKGLQLAWNLGLRRVLAETDCKNLYDLLIRDCEECSLSSMVQQIKEFSQRPWDLRFILISRCQNKVADQLAKDCCLQSNFIDSCPPSLRSLVLQDCMGFNSPPSSF
ncbi:hypothetical protein QN277_006916 [Acacia crassicarpa]|uniref:Uncharacterized protein n=1 Tax=Acacia crassicarpa TaxID=499986 RepID=A0AAE1IUB8_9FABA|nr:hypothetical protein QN277_006916 [Acacia crassicarpa]